MKKLTSILTAILFLSGIVYGQGTVIDTTFYSQSLDTTRFVKIYLPEGYNPNDVIRYPVIYYLHGFLSNQNSKPFIIDSVSALIGNGTIKPVIFVKSDGRAKPLQSWDLKGSMYTNSELNGRFEDYIVYDLVDFIDTNYKTIASRDKRCIMGLSMGGGGAMTLALKHPDIYKGLASHSGRLEFNSINDLIPYVLAQSGGSPPYQYSPDNGFPSQLLFSLASAFSPNLANPPYLVDFILDSSGNKVDSVWAKWLLHNPPKFANALPPDTNLAIYFDCGEQDELLLFPYNVNFADSLDKLGLSYKFLPFQGGHSDKFYSRLPISLTFLDLVINVTATSISVEKFEKQVNVPQSIILHQNYPNPFNAQTMIEYQLPQAGHVRLVIHNLLGQKINTLIDRTLQAGLYRAVWDGKDSAGRIVPSGVYFYRLKVNHFSMTKKMLLLQ